MIDYAKVIKDLRAREGMTVNELANKLETSFNSVLSWERGERTPQRRKKWAIKKACEKAGIYVGLDKSEWGV